MSTYKIHHANTHEEKDLYEIVVMVGFLAAVVGAVTGYMMMKVIGAIGGAILGCLLGSGIVHRIVTRGMDNDAKEIKFRQAGDFRNNR